MRYPYRAASLAVAAFGAFIGVAQICAATIPPSVVIGSAQLSPSNTPQSGIIDVYFTSSLPDPIDVAGIQLLLEIVGPDDAVTFTGAAAPAGRAYLFAPDSPGPFASASTDGRRITIGDFLNAGNGRIVDGAGIASVQFMVQPAAAGKTYDIILNLDPNESFLGVGASQFLQFNAQNGAISVVPEPAAGTLLIFAVNVFVASRLGTVFRLRGNVWGGGQCC